MLKAIGSLATKTQVLLAILFIAAGVLTLSATPAPFSNHAYAEGGGGCPEPEDDPCPEDFPYCCDDGACHDCPCEEEE